MTDLIAARSQMAMALGFHIVFAAIGMAMPLMMAVAEWQWLKTGRHSYLALAQRWAKGTAVLFAVGAVSGTVLSFELGLLWPTFMEWAGPVIGPLFALEGLAFFTEAVFLGIYLYGWSKLSSWLHLGAGGIVALSGLASAMFVVAANAWMNTPAGFDMDMGHPIRITLWDVMWNPHAFHEIVHMMLAAFAATGFLVAGIHAWLLLRDPQSAFHHQALGIALLCGGIPALLQPISGDLLAKVVADHQPAKLAAMEALFETQPGAPFVVAGVPDETTRTIPYSLTIPYGLSVLLHHDPQAVVQGLDTIPDSDWPPVSIVHIAFQLMVAAGLIMSFLALWSGWRWWKGRSFSDNPRLLRALILTAPLGFIAVEAGWVVTEVGRQPWIIYGIMRTSEAVTPMPNLWLPMSLFGVLYLILTGVVIWSLGRHVAATADLV